MRTPLAHPEARTALSRSVWVVVVLLLLLLLLHVVVVVVVALWC